MTDDLSRDLYANLVSQLDDMPPARRQRSSWAMNPEWFEECARVGGWAGPGDPTTMLGIPFHVTEDGGFPHLVAD